MFEPAYGGSAVVPLVECSQSSPVDHPHVVVPALMGGTSQTVTHCWVLRKQRAGSLY
jgi:hypothetical protein